MPQKTNIEWTATYLPDGTIKKGYSSNPIQAWVGDKRGWFCEKVSPGCGHCYSETLNTGRFGNGLHYTAANADKVEFRLNEKELLEIIKLSERLGKRGERARLFPFDMTDLFYERHPEIYLDKFFAVAALSPNIDFQILTKRPERMVEYLESVKNYNGSLSEFWLGDSIHDFAPQVSFLALREARIDRPLPNVWLGVSVENQEQANKRIPYLLDTPAAIRFLSIEPMLGPVDLTNLAIIRYEDGFGDVSLNCLNGHMIGPDDMTDLKIDWAIIGCESGTNRRPMKLEWAESLIEQCDAAGVPVFVKQLSIKGRVSHDPAEWPEHLRLRQFPTARNHGE